MSHLPLALGMPGPFELIIIGIIGLLFFGKRLPEVGRSVGRSIVEFKKGLSGVDEEIQKAASNTETKRIPADQTQAALPPADSQPKFDPYTGKPLQPAFDPYTGKPLETPR